MTQPMTDSKKLAAIRALRADVNPDGSAWLDAADVAEVLDAPSVPAARAGGIDRDALITLLGAFSGEAFGTGDIDYGAWGDRILALVQPAPPGGVRLTHEERAAIIRSRDLLARPHDTGWLADTLRALAARLEEAAS